MNTLNKMQLEGAVQQWADSFMKENNISAVDMESALNKIIIKLKDEIMVDCLLEMQNRNNHQDDDGGVE